ncbi:MAG: hypothetical protein J6S21_06360, partial [Victivallales bacterium]|nr:hypothetical protein [Victivallales bacterium]
NLKRTDLTITAAAVKLLAVAAESLPADNQARINAQEAIRDALNYALTVFVKNSPKLTWSADNESIQSAENGVGLLEIIEASRWLEHRKNLNVAKPEMEVKDVTLDRPAKELLWKNTAEASITSVRIYCVTSDVAPQYITHKNLVGIISRDKATVRNQDSIVAVRKILSAARREWGITPTSANAHYIEAKLKEVEQFAVGTASKKIRVTTPNTDAFAVVEGEEQKEFKFYAAAVNNYGELSDFVALEEAPAEAELELTDDLGAQF